MAVYLTRDLIWHLILFQSVVLLVILSNQVLIHRTRRHKPLKSYPLVSILVPARDEAENIHRCVWSLLAQDYPSFEVVVLDDHSCDATPAILHQLAAVDPRLTVLPGKALPEGWLGKNWACAQLAEQARGDLLLFTDADTAHAPHALTALVTAHTGEQADLLTGFPAQEMHSWGERLMVPFFTWAFLSFTPLVLAYLLKLPFLSGAVGQMLLFRRSAYQSVGGHASVRSQIAEDLALARRITSAGLRWRLTHLTDLISSRMYRHSGQAFRGFSKNYFAAFDFRLLPYLFVFSWLAVMFWLPLLILGLSLLGLAPHVRMDMLAACLLLSILLWVVPYSQLGFGAGLALLYPLTLLTMEGVALSSLWRSFRGHIRWKDRELGRQRWKWL